MLIWWITRKSANPPYILQSAAVQILESFEPPPVADCSSRRGGMGHCSVLTRERKVLPMTGPRRLIIKKPFQVRALFDADDIELTSGYKNASLKEAYLYCYAFETK